MRILIRSTSKRFTLPRDFVVLVITWRKTSVDRGTSVLSRFRKHIDAFAH